MELPAGVNLCTVFVYAQAAGQAHERRERFDQRRCEGFGEHVRDAAGVTRHTHTHTHTHTHVTPRRVSRSIRSQVWEEFGVGVMTRVAL